VDSFRDSFDLLLEDTFSSEELLFYEDKIDSMAVFFVQPLLEGLSFDDFYFFSDQEVEQRLFFNTCRSSICVENIPYLENNPFQVTYFIEFLSTVSDLLVDRGGVFELMFKSQFLGELKKFRAIDSLLVPNHKMEMNRSKELKKDLAYPLIHDVYKELERIKDKPIPLSELSEKVQKIYFLMKINKTHGPELLQKTGLNPKDFGDGLERLKFWLKKF
jgi:hypothetical protein